MSIVYIYAACILHIFSIANLLFAPNVQVGRVVVLWYTIVNIRHDN